MPSHDLSGDIGRGNEPAKEGGALTRAEWMAAAGLVLSALSWAYMAGVMVQQIGDLDRRATALEAGRAVNAAKIEQLLITSARIDANVAALTEQARERRNNR